MANDNSQQLLHEQLEAILENAVDAIITINERGVVESANPATETLFGYSVPEVVGQNVSMLMPLPFKDEHDSYLNNYLNSGVRKIIGIGREVVGLRKNGSEFPAHLAVSEIRTDNRVLFTGIVRDITDLKAAKQKLEELNHELENRVQRRTSELKVVQDELIRSEKLATLGQVSGGIAHEIRNPLNAIKTSAYFLLHAKNASEDKVKEHLERIDRQVTMIDNVVTALSDVAKLPEANMSPVDVEKLLRDVSRSTTLPSNIKKVFQFATELPHVMVDENQIPIAFRNLIRNARDSMPDGGELTLGAKVTGQYVLAYVADTGIGIPSDKLKLILEPMYTTKARGMGLGLAITRAIVIKNNCILDVESEEGKGSQFTIQIPIVNRDTKTIKT